MHFAEELSGQFRNPRKPLAAISISDPTHLSCTANDFGFEHIFSRYVEAIGQAGDVLLAISTSGNSENVVRAASEAKNKGINGVHNPRPSFPVCLGRGALKIPEPRAGSLFRRGNLIHSMPDEFMVQFRLRPQFAETSLRTNEEDDEL